MFTNTIDYIRWRGDLPLSADPVNEVDRFICAFLSYPDYTGVLTDGPEAKTIGEVSDAYFTTHDESLKNLGLLQSKLVLPALRVLPQEERFKDFRMAGYCNHVDTAQVLQFSAVTFLLPDGSVCVSYRGTDDTIIGWKENFNLAIMDTVPAQEDAAEYLTWVAEQFPGPIALCGHSKGGNLAIYAAATVQRSVQDRIRAVYSFDGPGFSEKLLTSSGYKQIEDRIFSVLSQHSMVGALLGHTGQSVIVNSRVSGPYAHDGFNWEVVGPHFVRLNERSEFSLFFERTMAQSLSELNEQEKADYIEAFFDALQSTGARTLSELNDLSIPKRAEILQTLRNDPRIHRFSATLLHTIPKILLQETSADLRKQE